MNSSCRTTALSRGVLAAGALTTVLSLLLVIGGLTANTAAGETGQPAGVLGVIGLFLGGTLLAVGALARRVVPLGERR
ncbi:hypothetical protein [Streptomyces sp. NRRL B-24572]|uniref:hypothetical protein n=1 Tax=Streptomyces sp. NRRL B-24572 TaxID=1962156 RepID=UPI000A3A345C|nr:hypothetical protein [Streptomyces sp. NRRL B-24572]